MNPAPTDTLRRRVVRRLAAVSVLGFGVWWILSIVFHAALLGIFIVAAPKATNPSAESADLDMTISPDRVRDVVEEIREQEQERFKEKVEELLKVKQELDRLNADKIAQYNEIIKAEGQRSQEKLSPAAERVIAAQKEALAAQASAQKALGDFKAAQKKAAAATNSEDAKAAEATAEAAMKEALSAQDNAASAQHQAGVAQAEIAAQLKLTSNSPEALAAHQAAADAQDEAITTQGDAAATIKRIAEAKRAQTAAEEAAARQQDTLDRANARRADAQTALDAREKILAEARKKDAEARATADAATAAATSAGDAEKKRLAEQARQAGVAVKREQVTLARAEMGARQAQTAAKRIEELAAGQKEKTDEALALVKKRRDAVTEALTAAARNAQDQQQASTDAQKKSLDLQEAANTAIAKALAESQTGNPAPSLAAAQATVLPTADPADARNLAELYKQAQGAEVAVAETFKNVRAAELASIRKIPLSEALEMTKVAKPDRPDLDMAILSRDIADVKGVREQEQTINAASDQMDSMVALAQRMRELAAASGANLSVAEIQARSDRNERMENLAMEDAGAKAKDLSGEMAAADGDGAGAGYGTSGQEGAATPAAKPAAPAGYDTKNGVPDISQISPKDYKPLHGRTVREGMVDIEQGRNPAWMYVDTWYLIGPWPNPGRKNLNTKFPPETVVNLDAVYQGGRKNEVPMPIHWEFFQIPSKVTGKDRTPAVPMIMPPGLQDFEIYYAYTELWFDEAEDLWVAIGSDDQSKVWLNDQLIWKSADYYKVWVPNEGLRKVHFRKGINRVLYRLENGQNSGGFSFIVCLSKDAAQASAP